MNPLYIDDYSKYIDEPKNYTIQDTEEMRFIGVSELDIHSSNIQTVEDEFENMAIINENGKLFELSYFIDPEKSIQDTFYGNYYTPFGFYPENFKVITIPKQKWVIFNAEGDSFDKSVIISAIKSYFHNEWLKRHNTYKYDDNYEIAFECFNNEYLDYINSPTIRCEVWFPIKEKE